MVTNFNILFQKQVLYDALDKAHPLNDNIKAQACHFVIQSQVWLSETLTVNMSFLYLNYLLQSRQKLLELSLSLEQRPSGGKKKRIICLLYVRAKQRRMYQTGLCISLYSRQCLLITIIKISKVCSFFECFSFVFYFLEL